MIHHLHLDFETRSRVDLKVGGLHNYARNAEVLMLAWAVDDAPPQLWIPDAREFFWPSLLHYHMRRLDTQKTAWNAQFERAIFLHCLKIDIPREQWLDPMMMSRYASLPGKLSQSGDILGLGDDGKDTEGKRLINKFCKPNRKGVFVEPKEAPEDWAKFGEYCKQDVIAERAIYHRLSKSYSIPVAEEKVRMLDAKINETGLPVDMEFVNTNRAAVLAEKTTLLAEQKQLTGLENPNSPKQLLDWLLTRGYPFKSLGAKKVEAALANGCSPEVKRALELRQSTGKSSTSKLAALVNQVGPDGRLRYAYTYYGAARTGRWAGRGPQPHNFTRKPVKIGNITIDLRAVFKAPPGKKMVVCDLSAIENRGLGWVTGCDAILRVFREGLDPYLDFATRLFNCAYDAVTKDQRQTAKPAVLGCGYGLGPGDEVFDCCRQKVMDGHREGCEGEGDVLKTGLWGYSANMGIELTREQCVDGVDVFRSTYSEVKQFWYDIADAFRTAMENPGKTVHCGPIRMGAAPEATVSGKLERVSIILPSGRRLHYLEPRMISGKWPDGRPKTDISYMGLNGLTKQWQRERTYGGKLTENIVQALARDILADGLLRAEYAGFEIVGHTHDEIISLVPADSPLGLAQLRTCMIERPTWAPDLILEADGFEGEVYHK